MSENESKKMDKYLDFATELEKLCNKKVTVMLILADALEMVPKDLEKLGELQF